MATLLLTDALADSLAEAVRNAVPIDTAVRAAGISPTQFYAWLQVAESQRWPSGDPVSPGSLRSITAFAEKIRRAEADHEAEMIRRISDASQTANFKTGVPEWRAGAWLLNNHPRYRATYRQERIAQVEHTGLISHEHQLVRTLKPEALEAAYTALHSQPDELPPLSG